MPAAGDPHGRGRTLEPRSSAATVSERGARGLSRNSSATAEREREAGRVDDRRRRGARLEALRGLVC